MRYLRSGFTLIELIIFIVIAGIFVPLTYIAFSGALKQGMNPENVTTARLVAEQAAELAVKRGYTQLVSDIGTGNVSTGNLSCSGVTVPSGYGCYWTASYRTFDGATFATVSAPPPTPLPNYILVSVTVQKPVGTSYFTTNTLVTNHGY